MWLQREEDAFLGWRESPGQSERRWGCRKTQEASLGGTWRSLVSPGARWELGSMMA